MAVKFSHRWINDQRYYVATHDDGSETVVPGVTSVLNMIPHDYLQNWYAKESGLLAVKSIEHLQDMAAFDKQGAVDYVTGAARRYTKRRGAIGSAAHTTFELLVRGEPRISVADAIEGNEKLAYLLEDEDALAEAEIMTDHFEQFLQTVQPELVRAEDVAFSSTHGYCGSFDAVLKLQVNPLTGKIDLKNGETQQRLVDWKTGRSVYPTVAAQMTAYTRADVIVDTDGNDHPMLDFDGAGVLHVTAKTWAFKDVVLSDDIFNTFLACLTFLQEMRTWEGEGKGLNKVPGVKDGAIGKSMALKSRAAFKTGTERRAA
jgi:hypothetical protein